MPRSFMFFFYLFLTCVCCKPDGDLVTRSVNLIDSNYLVWSDEFNGTDLNTNDWNYETGGNGWGNNELENYTSGTNNAYLQNGNLVIEAKKENSGSNSYTSARLTTSGKKSFLYGRVDIRAKIPNGKGIWPALWMLGQNISTVNWPFCGEIDIMENISETKPAKNYGTAHWGVSTAAHLSSGGSTSLTRGLYSDSFHVYSLDWSADKIQWLIDGVKFYEVSKQQITGGNFPFDKPFFLILNVAVGGNWPGNPDITTVFPQKMLVDYVRVYQK